MIAWWLAGLARAECDARTLMELARSADRAFAGMNADEFAHDAEEIDRTLACGTEVLTPIQVVAYHRTKALAAFFRDDDAQAILSFQSALAAMPGYELPLDIAPDGHPLRKLFEQAALFAPGDPFELPEPESGWVMVDGTRTRTAPAARPFVFQRLDADGKVLATQYVPVGSPIPSYPARVDAADPDPRPRSARPGLVATGVALAVVAGGAYGTAFVTRSRYDDAVAVGDEPAIRSSYWTTNGLVGGSIGLALVGGTLVVVGAF